MTPQVYERMGREAFSDATKELGDWASIDDLVKCLDLNNFWDDDWLERAEEQQKKAFARRLIKSLKDDGGWPLWASVEVPDANGDIHRVYKQEMLFDVEDYRKVTNYHAGRSRYHRRMAEGFARRCKERHGVQLQFDFD